MTAIEALKKAAAEKAVEQITSGMVLGLGTGSTTKYAVIKIGQLWQQGALTGLTAIPTSEGTAELARDYGLPLSTLAEHPRLDLAIDGADEVDPQLNMIKGLGGALLREKMIESVAAYFIVIVDETKLVSKLGAKGPLPVEVTQFGWQHQANWLAGNFNCAPRLRGGQAAPFVTDNGNYILDCAFPQGIERPVELAHSLKARTGIVEHGLFLGMADEVIVAGAEGLRSLK